MENRERGDSKLPLILMILVLAAIIFVLVKVVPARVNAYEFRDFMDEYSRTQSWERSEEQIKKDLIEKATRLKLPLRPENIQITKAGASLRMGAKFDVPIDLKVYTLVLHYNFTQDTEHY